MDHSGNGDDNIGIPDEFRCKRSDGKQWRCTAKCMHDKTVCEKHYIQAKKRSVSSALRASIKKTKRKSFGESDSYLESKMEDFDMPVKKGDHQSFTNSKKRNKSKGLKNQIHHSPETTPMHNYVVGEDDSQSDTEEFQEEWRPNKTANLDTGNSSKSRSHMSFDAGPSTEESDGNMDSSEDAGGIACHHCRRNDMDTVFWCSRCDRRGYCDSCISKWYSGISLEDIRKACPACRGTCSCKVCLRGDVLLKMKIREIPVIDKLQYLYSLLSSVLPVIQRIHQEQHSEVEMEKSLRGAEINLARAKLNEDEQMCCNVCRIPIIDYHRHCTSCSYDVCLHCCKDLRKESDEGAKGTLVQNQNTVADQNGYALDHLRDTPRLNMTDSFPDWEADPDGNIPCLPKTYGGCGYPILSLSRIFKMNWVAKLVRNVEEIVSGCKVNDCADELNVETNTREDSSDNTLYCPTSENVKTGIIDFRKRWVKGEPILVKDVWDSSCLSNWAPTEILRAIQDTADDRTKCENIRVKAIDCLSCSEIDIDLDQFIKGYSEGRFRDTGSREMLKLKDWPSPSASEELLLYQRAEFISKFPLLEYIHSKWGVLNVAAKLPHYSLQNDVGPRILISYGTKHEIGKGDSVTNLHYKMRDMVYLLAHTHDVKSKIHQISVESTQKCDRYLDVEEPSGDSYGEKYSSHFHSENDDVKENYSGHMVEYIEGRMDKSEIGRTFPSEERNSDSSRDDEENGKKLPGALWDVFRREDVPKLLEYLEKNSNELGNVDSVAHHLFDGALYLSWQHKRQLKDEFGIEPWSFEQHLGTTVFIPAGCPFQLRNLQSTVELALDFLSPESLGVAVKLAEEVRCLPNDHEAKVQTLEVGKISLYAASSAIKEVQKLVLDSKSSAELGFEDLNLTASVSENLEKITKRKQVMCP